MKYFLSILLALIIPLSFSSCNRNTEDKQNVTSHIAQEEYDYDEIDTSNSATTKFNPITRTLTVKGKGKIENVEGERFGFKKVVFREGITEISYCFSSTSAYDIESIKFPSSLKSIVNSFSGLKSLKKLVIPDTIENIDFGSFDYSSIEELSFKGPINIDEAFTGLENLERVVIPEGSVCTASFQECENLKEVIIEKNVQLNKKQIRDDCDDDPFVNHPIFYRYNFSSGDKSYPKAYLHLPTDGEEHPWGEGGNYKPIIIADGKSWEDYKDVPMKKR